MDPRESCVGSKGAVIRGALTAIRSAEEDDVDLLVGWHLDPEVARFWDWETYTREEVRQRLMRDDLGAFVIVETATDAPVGLLEAWTDDEWATGGLDMFLVPRARGRGLGPDAARALARHLVRDCGWSRVTVDPYVWNASAIRAWARAGFEPEGEHPPDAEHTAQWLLMVFVDDERGQTLNRV
jgi:aminoglycoside 6'-N-acetyltransferase